MNRSSISKDCETILFQVPPYAYILMCCLAYRIHSIFVLRLFNDPIAMTFLYISIVFLLRRQWTVACLLYRFVIRVSRRIVSTDFLRLQFRRVDQNEHFAHGTGTVRHSSALRWTSFDDPTDFLLRRFTGEIDQKSRLESNRRKIDLVGFGRSVSLGKSGRVHPRCVRFRSTILLHLDGELAMHLRRTVSQSLVSLGLVGVARCRFNICRLSSLAKVR